MMSARKRPILRLTHPPTALCGLALATCAVLALALFAPRSSAGEQGTSPARRAESASPFVVGLMYHHFSRKDPPAMRRDVYVVGLPRFERQLAEIKRLRFRALSTREALDAARGATLQTPGVLITIDDGYQSVLLAAPALKKHGMRATIFVTADPSAFVFDPGDPLTSRLTDQQIACLDPAVFDVQSHGWSHAPMRGLSDRALLHELRDSRAALERLTGRPVTCLSIPGNWYDARVLRFAREAGYEAVFVSDQGVIMPGADRFRLPRNVVQGYKSLAGFRAMLLGGPLDRSRR